MVEIANKKGLKKNPLWCILKVQSNNKTKGVFVMFSENNYNAINKKGQVNIFNKLKIELQATREVRIEKCGDNIANVIVANKTTSHIKKMSATEYLIIGTGEVKTFEKKEGKQQENLKKTFKNLMSLINTNFEGGENQLFVTLTYRENMQDSKRLMKDFETFFKRLGRAYKEYDLGYISVAEPQGRGAWHLHIMLKEMQGKKLYIDNKDMARIWGHGFTDTERLKGDNVGAYYVTYFTDILEGEGNDKKKKKHERLKLYPNGMRFYRASTNMKRPISEYMSIGEIVKEYGQPTYSKSYEVIGENGEKINDVTRLQFNKKRDKKQEIKILSMETQKEDIKKCRVCGVKTETYSTYKKGECMCRECARNEQEKDNLKKALENVKKMLETFKTLRAFGGKKRVINKTRQIVFKGLKI